jgi:hypothetical protein
MDEAAAHEWDLNKGISEKYDLSETDARDFFKVWKNAFKKYLEENWMDDNGEYKQGFDGPESEKAKHNAQIPADAMTMHIQTLKGNRL